MNFKAKMKDRIKNERRNDRQNEKTSQVFEAWEAGNGRYL